MSYDYDRLFAQIIASVTSGGSITERMRADSQPVNGEQHYESTIPDVRWVIPFGAPQIGFEKLKVLL
jgi:hypothetical protein